MMHHEMLNHLEMIDENLLQNAKFSGLTNGFKS